MNSAAQTCRSHSPGWGGIAVSGQQSGGFRLNQSPSAAVAIPDGCPGENLCVLMHPLPPEDCTDPSFRVCWEGVMS